MLFCVWEDARVWLTEPFLSYAPHLSGASILSSHLETPFLRAYFRECLQSDGCSVQSFSCVSLWPHRLQQASLPCPSPTPWAYSNSCPSSWWCLPAISSSVIPFSSHLQPFPTSGSFLMRQFFVSGGQSIGASAPASILPMNIQDWFPLGWTGLISLQSKEISESSPAPQFKSINSSVLSFLYSPALTTMHDYWKNHSFD